MSKKVKNIDYFTGEKLLFWGAMLAVLISILFLATTIMKPGVPAGHDISAHSIRSRVFYDAIEQGQFPVRWIDWSRIGLDHPLFNFYQVGFYYLVSSVKTFLPSLADSIKLTVTLLWWMGAFFMFLFARRFGNLSGAAASLVFAFTPYTISDVFVRAAYPEFAALAFIPGVLWACDRLITQNKPIFALPLALCLLGVITSHLPTLVIFMPVLGAYIIFLVVTREANIFGLTQFGVAVILGLGVSAFYLLPAILELNLINTKYLTSGSYDFRSHFIVPEQLFKTTWGYGISVPGPNDGMSFQIGLFNLLIIFASIIYLIWLIYSKKEQKYIQVIIFWLGVILYGFFFAHNISFAFWDGIQQMGFIQYPWRFLIIVPIATGVLASILLTSLTNITHKGVAVLAFVFLIFFFYHSFLKPPIFLPYTYFNIDSKDWSQAQGLAIYETFERGYMPKGVQMLPKEEKPLWEIIEGRGTVEARDIRFHKKIFDVAADSDLNILVSSHYFVGWKAFIDNKEVKIASDNPYGFIQVIVPGGKHELLLEFRDTPVRKAANIISLLAIFGMLGWQVVSAFARMSPGR